MTPAARADPIASFPWRRLAWLLVLAAAAVAGCTTLDGMERRWIFQPSKDTWNDVKPGDGVQDAWIAFQSPSSGAKVKLHALWVPADKAAGMQPALSTAMRPATTSSAPLLLYLHGARWDVRGSLSRIRRMQSLGFSVLAIDYRGFGESGDDLPSEASADEDARAAFDWLGRQHPGVPRYIFGHSLGGAVAVALAADVGNQAAGVILESTFTSIRDVVASFRWGWLPVGGLITQPFDSASRIAEVRAPLLVVHGSDDDLIRPSLGKALYDRATVSRKQFMLVEGGSHHTTNDLGQDQYREALRTLFGIVVPPNGTADAPG